MITYVLTAILILVSLVFYIRRRKHPVVRLSKEQATLFTHISKNNFEAFKNLFEATNENASLSQGNGTTLLMYATSMDYGLPFCEYLLSKGADVNAQDNSGRTALLMACHWYTPEMIDIFVKYKANLNHISKIKGYVNCALLALLNKNKIEAAKDLIKKGASAVATESCFKDFKQSLSSEAIEFYNEQLRWEKGLRNFEYARRFQKAYKEKMKQGKAPEKFLILANLPAKHIEGIRAYC